MKSYTKKHTSKATVSFDINSANLFLLLSSSSCLFVFLYISPTAFILDQMERICNNIILESGSCFCNSISSLSLYVVIYGNTNVLQCDNGKYTC